MIYRVVLNDSWRRRTRRSCRWKCPGSIWVVWIRSRGWMPRHGSKRQPAVLVRLLRQLHPFILAPKKGTKQYAKEKVENLWLRNSYILASEYSEEKKKQRLQNQRWVFIIAALCVIAYHSHSAGGPCITLTKNVRIPCCWPFLTIANDYNKSYQEVFVV